jgi:AraC-like DNA-binding protein
VGQSRERRAAPASRPVPVVRDFLNEGDAITARFHSRDTIEPEISYDMHYELEFGVLLAGRIRRVCRGWQTDLIPGDVWFQGPWEPHGTQQLAVPRLALVFAITPRVLLTSRFDGAPDYDWMAPFTAPPASRPQTTAATRPELLQVGRRLQTMHEQGARDMPLWDHVLLLTMLLAVREGWKPPVQGPRPAADSYHRIDPAIALVFESRRAVSLEEAANACAMARNTFGRLFRSLMGVTFAKYCLRHRLSSGATHLLRTSDPVKAIALEWGFTDPSHFSRCFGEHYGCSPAEYRRRALRGPLPR